MSSTTGSTTTAALPKVETAWDWLQRVKKEKAAPPNDPHGAAWAFCRGATGIAFVDAALKQNEIPTIDIRGSSSAGKTLTVIRSRHGSSSTPAPRPLIVTRSSSSGGTLRKTK
jgi:predicted dienelactone hydrolase